MEDQYSGHAELVKTKGAYYICDKGEESSLTSAQFYM